MAAPEIVDGYAYPGPHPQIAVFHESRAEDAGALFLHACDAGDGDGCAAYAGQFRYGDRNVATKALRYGETGGALGLGTACAIAGSALTFNGGSPAALSRAARLAGD